MHLLRVPLTLLFSFLTITLTTALQSQSQPQLQTLTLHHLPATPSLSPPSSKAPLATLAFSPSSPHLSRLTSFTPPKNSTSLVQIGFCFPSSTGGEECRTTAAYAYAFHPPYKGRFKVLLDWAEEGEENEAISVSYRAWKPASGGRKVEDRKEEEPKEKRYQPGGRGDFDIQLASQAPGVWVDRIVPKGRAAAGAGEKKDRDGGQGDGEEEVDERTFLQK